VETEIIKLDKEYYLSIAYLEKYNIANQTVYNGIRKNKSQESYNYWQFISYLSDKRLVYINYTSIPKQSIKKLPILESIEKEHLEGRDIKEHQKKTIIHSIAFYDIQSKINNGWNSVIEHYKHYMNDAKELKMFCQTHIAFREIIIRKNNTHSLKELFEIYLCLENLKFQTKSENYFRKKIRLAESSKIEITLLHSLINNTSNNIKLTRFHNAQIRVLYKNPKKYITRQIYEILNKNCINKGYKTISFSSLKRILADPKLKSECLPIRNGETWTDNNYLPYLHREKVKNCGDLWELDGTKIQFPILNSKNGVGWLHIFVVLDVCSSKIVGYSIDNFENTKMILKAIDNACKNTNYLPFQILHDNFSAFSSEEFLMFKSSTEMLGTNWRSASVGNARDKGHVERFFSTFQTCVCKPIDGYIGNGMTAKGIEGKPAPEVQAEALKKSNLRSKDQLIELVDELITKYNNLSINEKPSPNIQYELKKEKNTYYLNEHTLAFLFWQKKKQVIKNSEIIFQLDNEKLFYPIIDPKKSILLYKQEILFAYNPDDPQYIYLYDSITEEFYLKCEQFIPVQGIKEFQKDIDKESRKKHKEHKIEILKELLESSKRDEIEADLEYDKSTLLVLNKFSKKIEWDKAEHNYAVMHAEKHLRKPKKTPSGDININELGSYYEEGNLKVIS
jgi:hypothetical protein